MNHGLTIAGIDPELTTGITAIEWDGSLPINDQSVTPMCSLHVPYGEFPKWFRSSVRDVDVLAIERFTIGAGTSKTLRQYEALYVIGGIQYQLQLMQDDGEQIPLVLYNTPSAAKNAWNDDTLKEAGLYDSIRGTKHAKDALRHALLACYTKEVRTLRTITTAKGQH